MQWKLASLLFNKCEVNELGDIRTTKTKKIRKKYLDKRHKTFLKVTNLFAHLLRIVREHQGL
jgi:hypothetical protein